MSRALLIVATVIALVALIMVSEGPPTSDTGHILDGWRG